ncbi:hypothetical protein [Methanogenium cariaci]|nr:hypothetical protein [Methanogenium cariaci]
MQGSCDLDKIEEGFKTAVACAKKGTEGGLRPFPPRRFMRHWCL